MNTLEQYIREHGLNETRAMNMLQSETAIISDLAVNASDVADENCASAVTYLKYYYTNP